ncbi:putative disease resistance protein RGA3 [Bienertia sinuspersici]
MDVGIVLTLVQTVLQLLDSPISREIESLWGYKTQLQKLKNTMSIIQDVFVSVERQQRSQLSISVSPAMLDRLKETVYDADDLFDEIATIAHLKEMKEQTMRGNKASKEVRLFFSRFNQLHYAFTKSHQIRKIKEILDDIAEDCNKFGGFYQPTNDLEVRNIDPSRETYSFLCEDDVIIGRDGDRSIVINMLLHTSVEENVSVVSIVGIGGLGKTALAKLVFNDETIVSKFTLTMWVCVSDNINLNVKELVHKILVAATKKNDSSDLNFEELQSRFRQELNGKKYLLVLDDVWNEDPMKWDQLKILLTEGERGSKIIVTTRSTSVAEIAGSNQQTTHKLGGLSDDDSWNLFEKMVHKPGQVGMESHLVETYGKEIVSKCFNVPLAIRFVGSLLRGQDESMWRNLKNTTLSNIKRDDKDGIMPVLQISYNHLPSQLKSCFSYCTVFSKDYKLHKEKLIYLWMAQGFITPLNSQSLEDLGDECFTKLLQRCFFQDVKRDEMTGVIKSCKMHDLVHDLAKRVSGIRIDDSSGNDVFPLHDEKTRHICIDDTFVRKNHVECDLTKMIKLRTYLVQQSLSTCDRQIAFKMRHLRVLDLSDKARKRNVIRLPSMIGELLHLRYLDLSNNDKLCELPDSITQLYNLQTLKLYRCDELKELPRELRKLVNLRYLDLDFCDRLRHMPRGMNRLTFLHKLTMFVLGDGRNVGCLGAHDVGKLEDLKHLNNLSDYIQIEMKNGWTYDAEKVKEGGYLINKQLLNRLEICWNDEPSHDDKEAAEALLQGLRPHHNIKILRLYNYPGVRFPSWGLQSSMNLNMNAPLPNVVHIWLDSCKRLEQLPLLSQLRHLKQLELKNLCKLEYVEMSKRSGDELVFFPSLTKLVLRNLPELKGWWKTSTSNLELKATSTLTSGEGETSMTTGDGGQSNNNNEKRLQGKDDMLLLNFPCLSEIKVIDCGKLRSVPEIPKVKDLELKGSSNLLGNFHSLPMESFHNLSNLHISDFNNNNEVERLSTMEMFQSGRLPSLQYLEIYGFRNLKSIWGRGVWEHFTALHFLVLSNLPELDLEEDAKSSNTKGEREEKENNGNDATMHMHMPWRWLATTLCELTLHDLPRMVRLPKGMQHLTALRDLDIRFCVNLEELPPWIHCFSSLKHLAIDTCPRVKSLPEEMRQLTCLTHLWLWSCPSELMERCKEPTGVDCPKIQHIPFKDIWG